MVVKLSRIIRNSSYGHYDEKLNIIEYDFFHPEYFPEKYFPEKYFPNH